MSRHLCINAESFGSGITRGWVRSTSNVLRKLHTAFRRGCVWWFEWKSPTQPPFHDCWGKDWGVALLEKVCMSFDTYKSHGSPISIFSIFFFLLPPTVPPHSPFMIVDQIVLSDSVLVPHAMPACLLLCSPAWWSWTIILWDWKPHEMLSSIRCLVTVLRQHSRHKHSPSFLFLWQWVSFPSFMTSMSVFLVTFSF